MEWYTRPQGNTESMIARVCFLANSLFIYLCFLPERGTFWAAVPAGSSSRAAAGSRGVTLAGRGSRPLLCTLCPARAQSGMSRLGRAGGKVAGKAGREISFRIPVLYPCWLWQLQEPSEHKKQPVFLSCFLHPSSTFLLFPSSHVYPSPTKSCEQLKTPLADCHPLLLRLVMTRSSPQLILSVC